MRSKKETIQNALQLSPGDSIIPRGHYPLDPPESSCSLGNPFLKAKKIRCCVASPLWLRLIWDFWGHSLLSVSCQIRCNHVKEPWLINLLMAQMSLSLNLSGLHDDREAQMTKKQFQSWPSIEPVASETTRVFNARNFVLSFFYLALLIAPKG